MWRWLLIGLLGAAIVTAVCGESRDETPWDIVVRTEK
jgi:hypothetical protein